jgi:hypothetical protein
MSQEVIAPRLNVTEELMYTHLLTFLIQYLASVQHITDKNQLVYSLLNAWQAKFNQGINIVKRATAETYAEEKEEDQDVWNIILDVSNIHIEGLSKQFSENVRARILKNLKLV